MIIQVLPAGGGSATARLLLGHHPDWDAAARTDAIAASTASAMVGLRTAVVRLAGEILAGSWPTNPHNRAT